MRKKIMWAVCSLISTGAVAQDTLKTTTTLQEVVFSATRADQHLLDVPRSATVIGRDAIEKSIYNSVGELLSQQEGIYVVGANQTPGTNQTLFMRGANSNQVAVMVDGTRITDPSSPNAAVDLSELSLTDVERIEIIRGSHTTLYGGAAIGGVINIITRKGSQAGFHGNISVTPGTFGKGSSSFTEQVDAGYSFGNGIYFSGSLFQQNVNGLNASVDTTALTRFKPADKDDFTKTDGYLKAGFKNEKWNAFLSYKKIDQHAEIDNGAFNDDDNNYLDFERDIMAYQIRHALSPQWSVMALGSWNKSLRFNENDSSAIDNNGATNRSYFKGTYNGKLQTHELQANFSNEHLNVVLGSGLYSEEMFFDTYYFSNAFGFPFTLVTNYDSIDSKATTGYAFAQASYSINDFTISAGTRFSNHSLFGNYFTYDVSPSYRMNNTLLYLSLSSGFNAPSLYQLYDPAKGFGAFTSKGNRKLEPEESISLEIGVKREFGNGSFVTLSAFQTVTKNSIEYVYLWEGSKAVSNLGFGDYRGDTYINIAEQEVTGIEASGKLRFNDKFSLQGNITALKGKVNFSPADLDNSHTGNHHVQVYSYGSFLNTEIENDKMIRRPKVTAFGMFSYNPVQTINLNIAYRYGGARNDSGYDATLGPFGALRQINIESYGLMDLGASWTIKQKLTLSTRIENVFNEQYQEIQGFQTRGRSAYLKVSFKW